MNNETCLIDADLMRERAIELAGMGMAVLPLQTIIDGHCSCGRFCRSPGKHPACRGGFKAASKDQSKVWGMFNKPRNIGVATGIKSGIVVVDVDKDKGGYESLAKIERDYGRLSLDNLVANTGGGGIHIFFDSNGYSIASGVNVLGPGIDIRGDGGYVVGPPSLHASGNIYEWKDGLYKPNNIPVELIDLLKQRDRNHPLTNRTKIYVGMRNTHLTRFAGKLRARGAELEELILKVQSENIRSCNPPLDSLEAISIAKSIARYRKGQSASNLRDIWLDSVFGKYSTLNSTTRLVLAALSRFMNAEGEGCFPSQELIAYAAGLKKRQTVSAHIQHAIDLGYLSVCRINCEGRTGWRYEYKVLIPMVYRGRLT